VDVCYLVRLFVIRNFRGTRSSVELLKACMVREKLGTPELEPTSRWTKWLLL